MVVSGLFPGRPAIRLVFEGLRVCLKDVCFAWAEQGLQKRFCILRIMFRHTAVPQDMDF
jgi:hypothetical protein